MDFESQIEKIAKDIRDREDREMALAFTNVVGSLLKENGVVVKTSRYELETDNESDKNKYIIKKEYGVSFDGLDFTEHDKKFKDEIKQLESELFDVQKSADEYYNKCIDLTNQIEKLKSELELKGSEIERLKKRIGKLASIRVRCHESARDSFDLGNYGCLHIVTADELKTTKDKNDRTVELPFDALETANMLINAEYKSEAPFLNKQVDMNVYDIDDLEQIAEYLLVYCKHNKGDDV